MGALNALQRSPGALIRNPVLVIPVLVIGLLQLPQLLLQTTDPLLASLVSLGISLVFILVMPFFQGGIIGMADEALRGRTRLGSFLAAGRANYLQILVAYLLVLVINFLIGGVLFVVGVTGALLFYTSTEVPGAGFLVGGLFFVLLLVVFLLLTFFLQFYGQAIVLDNRSAVDGIKRSYRVVRRNLPSTIGYTIIATVFGGGLGLVLAGLSMVASPRSAQVFDVPEISFPVLAAAILVVIVIASVVGSFLAIFSVAFYRDISG